MDDRKEGLLGRLDRHSDCRMEPYLFIQKEFRNHFLQPQLSIHANLKPPLYFGHDAEYAPILEISATVLYGGGVSAPFDYYHSMNCSCFHFTFYI